LSNDNTDLSPASIQSLFEIIAPGSEFISIHALEGDFSNSTQLVECNAPDGSMFQIVTRRYAIFGDYDRGEKARREFKTLALLKKHGLPVPKPLYLDDSGKILGSPGIVTGYMAGKLHMERPFPVQWAEKLAKTLARIHTVPIHSSNTSFLLDGNSEVLWFLKSKDSIPEYISAYPKGAALWQAMLDFLPKLKSVEPSLVHIDYWSGNVLWDEGAISAIVDWEEAAQGDPGIDVAYCRMDLILCGLPESADKFLETYEKEVGRPVSNLGFWELAAAVRPMFSPDGWISEATSKERFAYFVDEALQRTRRGE
jgi:aminoglycoside phosphotransferase (APT) family kinase protein